MEDLTRRNFLKGASAFGAAALAGTALAACSPTAEPDDTGTGMSGTMGATDTDKIGGGYANPDGIGILLTPDATEDADMVVVGSGLGGFSAAILTKEQMPDATVVLLEKNSGLGGSTNFAEGNMPDKNQEDHLARYQGYERAKRTGFIANTLLHYERKREKGDCADWLFCKQGIPTMPLGPFVGYEGGNGTSAINKLTPNAEAIGVDIRTDSRVIALLTGDEYTVTGVQYKGSDGKVTNINAKAVVLATGGVSTNKELLHLYCSQDTEKLLGWGQGQDGDGLLLVEQTAHGRAKYLCLDSCFNNIGNGEDNAAYDSPLGVCAAMQYTDLFINENGLRFADESGGGTLENILSGKLVESQGYVFSILNSAAIAKYEAGGCSRNYSGFADAMVGNPIDLQADLELYKDKDYVFKADTIEDLGAAIAAKVPYFNVDTFVAEIAKYNGYAEAGEDLDYRKAPELMWPVTQAPFYAFQLVSGLLNTVGGIRINQNTQVIDARGKVIENLYAAGICSSGFDGEIYIGNTCQSVALWGGCRAARHAITNKLRGTVAPNWMGDERSVDLIGPDAPPLWDSDF
jgi:fumarate reductase flavoprotein subunit